MGEPVSRPFDFEAAWRSLAEDDPITHSFEGLDDACWYCGADSRSKQVPRMLPDGRHAHPTAVDFVQYAEHDLSCQWVRARLHFAIPLGHHEIAATP
jgi:hypothetical protein